MSNKTASELNPFYRYAVET